MTEQKPGWEVVDGKVIIDGVDVTEIARFGADEGPEDETPKQEPAADNAVLEGDEVEPEVAKEPVEEPVKEVEPPKVPDKEPVKPTEPEKLKFKLKFRGKEDEVEYDPSQIQVRLNKLRAFEENEKEFWEQRKKVEPYAPIVESEWFKAKLAEAYESGELSKPEEAPAPPSTVQYEVIRRKADQDYDAVMESLRDYARNLPLEAVKILDSDASVFLSEYDRIATELRSKKVEPEKPQKSDKQDPKDVKAKLALKESAKTRAAVAQPGTMGEPPDPNRAVQKRLKELERAIRDPARKNQTVDIAAEMILIRDNLRKTQ